jgi:nucleoside-diphosphate-sugar epimerase
MQKTILITGSAGGIGTVLRKRLSDRYIIRSLDRIPTPDVPEAVVTDLSDLAVLQEAMTGVDTLIHLAATPVEAPFIENLVPNNLIGVYNTFEAARLAGVSRILFASTVQTVLRYPADKVVEIEDAPNPFSIYGATKSFGEILGRWYHETYGIEFLGVRIGWHNASPEHTLRFLQTNKDFRRLWLSSGDCAKFFRLAIDASHIGYGVAFATSHTDPQWASLKSARAILGYDPDDDVRSVPFVGAIE